jgi:hypothetical protein
VRTRSGIAVLAVVVSVVIPASVAARGTPGVRISDTHPVTVVGRNFAKGERVRVVLSLRGTYVRKVLATRQGRFVLRFPYAGGECSPIRVAAKGNRGSTASYTVTPTCGAAQTSSGGDGDALYPIDPQPKR